MRAMFKHRATARGIDVKRIYLKFSRLAGDLLQQSAAAVLALLLAAVRGLRLLPDDLPGCFTGTINVLEWAVGCSALVLVFIDKFYSRREKNHE